MRSVDLRPDHSIRPGRRCTLPRPALGVLAATLLSAVAIGSAPPTAAADPAALSLQQVLQRGLAVSADLVLSERRVAREQALVALGRAALRPQLALIGSGSFTQIGTSVGVLTNLPTFGDLSLDLRQNGYAVLQNSFANAGLVFDLNLLPLRQGAELAADKASLESSLAGQREQRRQVRFALVSAYRDLQLQQAMVPIWQDALKASTALEQDARAIQRRGLAARIDVLRSRVLRAGDAQGLAQARSQLASSRQHLAGLLQLPLDQSLQAADPIREQPPWPLDLEQTLALALRERPLLESLQAQQRAQGQQARAARLALMPSLSLLAGAGLSADRLVAPVLNQGGRIEAGGGSLTLPELQQRLEASGSFYNWGAALMLRQPLYDGGRAAAAASLAERTRLMLQADEELARRRIRDDVSRAWNALAAAPELLSAAREAVQAGERALRDAGLRYRAMVEPLTEVLLVQRDLQVARAALLTALIRQASDRAELERETGAAEAEGPLH
ncbi:MAG: TolC family protein [Synechococcaceae cyanobacterium]|nr:TolC family protein [Synechococcaceae cyanobacterium]